jgi:hypothetical protein
MAHCNFSYRFSFGFGLMATCFHGRLQRDSPRGIAISARKLAQMRADFCRFRPVRHRCSRRDFDVGVIILTLV